MAGEGEIRWINVDSLREDDVDRRRPAVLMSNDRTNSTVARMGRGEVTVVLVTRNTERPSGCHVLLPEHESGLGVEALALCDQIRSLPPQRLGPVIGRLSPSRMDEIDTAVRNHLQL